MKHAYLLKVPWFLFFDSDSLIHSYFYHLEITLLLFANKNEKRGRYSVNADETSKHQHNYRKAGKVLIHLPQVMNRSKSQTIQQICNLKFSKYQY